LPKVYAAGVLKAAGLNHAAVVPVAGPNTGWPACNPGDKVVIFSPF